MKTNRAVIIQCRLSSTRLPNKALKKLGNKVVLEWVLQSMSKIKADRYFVATDKDSYDQLKPICAKYDFECFAGNLEDVLKRFCDLIKTIDVKTIVRATADNPFLFYEAAQESLLDFENRNKGKMVCDYLTWTGLPHGSGVEIFSAQALLKASTLTTSPYDHEHVGPALYNHQEHFKCEFIKAPARFNHPELRTTIDTYSDYLRAISIVNYLGDKNDAYTTEQIISACNSKQVKYPVVLVPSVTKGFGTGHLHRCLEIAINSPFFVYIPQEKTLQETDAILLQYIQKGLQEYKIISQIPDQSYLPLIITDTFELTQDQLKVFNQNRGIIAIDDGSSLSDYCDYLLDIIPSYKTERISNCTNSNFITKPNNIKTNPCDINNINEILICLGGEDPKGLTVPAVNAISECFPKAKITAIISNVAKLQPNLKSLESATFIEPIPNLREQLFKYDLVITHYGFTAFEACYAGCGVILLPTTKLHSQLAQKYNFAFVQDERVDAQSLLRALASENVFRDFQQTDNQNQENKFLPYFLQTISYGSKLNCPICDKQEVYPNKIISRNATRTYRRCSNCGIIYMAWTCEAEKEYKESYFFEDYKKQYGKTYQEDFEFIKNQGKRRLNNILQVYSSFSSLQDKNLLDIGCAYGPFLSAAMEYKLNPYGTDISSQAINYVQDTLHLPATCADFPNLDILQEFGLTEFDIITMWYVIEHFKNLDIVLRKVNSILKKGGVFAFSTPSAEGISAKSDKSHFYQISPSDHYSIWEPSTAHKILSKYGFEVIKTVSTGHHPERFPTIQKTNAKSKSLQWKLTEQLSKLKKLGDTCEIYCRKIR